MRIRRRGIVGGRRETARDAPRVDRGPGRRRWQSPAVSVHLGPAPSRWASEVAASVRLEHESGDGVGGRRRVPLASRPGRTRRARPRGNHTSEDPYAHCASQRGATSFRCDGEGLRDRARATLQREERNDVFLSWFRSVSDHPASAADAPCGPPLGGVGGRAEERTGDPRHRLRRPLASRSRILYAFRHPSPGCAPALSRCPCCGRCGVEHGGRRTSYDSALESALESTWKFRFRIFNGR